MPLALIHFSPLDYGIFALYLLLTSGVGLLFARQKDTKEYLLADRSMGYIIVGVSVLAAFFSGISYLAYPSEIYSHGIGFFFAGVSFFIATPLTTIIFLPFYCRSRFYTAYQYLEQRFAVQVRVLASSLFIVQVLIRLALATYAPALALEQVTGLPIWFTILCTGILTTCYTAFGGIKAVIWTDVMQFVVLMGGQMLILIVAVTHVPGGVQSVYEIARDNGKLTLDFSFDPHVRMTFWGALLGGALLNLVQMATDQIAVQRYLTATSLTEARRALWLKLWLIMPVIVIFLLTGLVLFAFYHIHGDPIASGKIKKMDQILPFFVANELPAGVPGLLIAAIYGATMASVSSGINSLSSATMVDFYGRLWKGAQFSTEAARLKLARGLTVMYGILVIVIAFQAHRFGTLVEASNKAIGLVGGPLLGMFILGMFSRRATVQGAIAGWFVGLLVAAYVCFATTISFLWYTASGFSVTLLTGWTVSRLFPPPSSEKLDGLTWGTRYQEANQAVGGQADESGADTGPKTLRH